MRQLPVYQEQILDIARHAPSSHNTQPWLAKSSGDSIVIGYEPARQLRIADPNKRELFISLGCFVESIMLAAKVYGYEAGYEYVGNGPQKVASVKLKKYGNHTEARWEKLIRSRRSDRTMYKPQGIPAKDVSALSRLSQDDTSVTILTDPADIKFLAEMTQEAVLKSMSDPAFRAELAGWIRNNWTGKRDGMPAHVQGIPGPVSLVAKHIIKKMSKTAKDQAEKDSGRVLNSPAVALICVDRETTEKWLSAGRLLQRLLLEALDRNIKTAAISAAVINPQTTKQIRQRFGLKSAPVAFVRMGYSDKRLRPSPRLEVSDFLMS